MSEETILVSANAKNFFLNPPAKAGGNARIATELPQASACGLKQ